MICMRTELFLICCFLSACCVVPPCSTASPCSRSLCLSVTDVSEDLSQMSLYAARTSQLIQQQTLQYQHDVRTALSHPSSPSLPCLGGRWQLGMGSALDAQSLMNEI